jgi:hypothetical protein
LFFLVSSSKKTAVLPSNSVSATDKATIVQQKPKIKSYKNLLKLAKAVTPAGLISAPSSNTQAKEIFPDQSKTKPRNRETMQISVKNPHHPDYRPPSSNNVSSSMAFRNIPKSKMISTKKFKVASKSSSKIPNDLIMLNTKKRDLSTVEEIQEELLKKKHYSGNDVGRQQTAPLKRNEIESNGRLEKRVDPLLKSKHISPKNTSNQLGKKRNRETSFHRSDRDEVSQTIHAIFGYNRNRYYDDSDSSDMEVNYRDLEREEKKSLRIGKKEDFEEELKEIEKLKKKKKYQ